jgi:hypothetical protein
VAIHDRPDHADGAGRETYTHAFDDTGLNLKWGWAVADITDRVALSAP